MASTLIWPMGSAILDDLRGLLGPDGAIEPREPYLRDALVGPAVHPRADAVALPRDAGEVVQIVAWCYERSIAITPRGGGSGLTGGATPMAGGVVLALDRMSRVRSLDPLEWRIEVEAGLTTATVQRLARENGLYFPPDPGAAEQSQIGGNIATNAGGPHALKYGVTGDFVMGLEAVIPPGDVVRFGGPVRKDVAGFDLKRLLIGSEGALGVITSAWLGLVPAPEARLPLAAAFASTEAGCEAIAAIVGSGIQASAIEYLDRRALELTGGAFPTADLSGAGFLVLVEVDGSAAEVERQRGEVLEALAGAETVLAPSGEDERALWRWRDGMSGAVAGVLGGKISEDVTVPAERLAETIEATVEIGARHGLDACSWGHAGDANVHSTFLVSGAAVAGEEIDRVRAATEELMRAVVAVGGSISGEHGLGWLKADALPLQFGAREIELQREIKRLFDPAGLMNPGKWV